MGEPLTEIEIPCPDMPADGAARYRVMVAETQRMTREVAAMAEKLREAEADKARLAEDAVKLSTLLQEATARAEAAREAALREAAEVARRGREVRKPDGTTEIEDIGDDAVADAILALISQTRGQADA